MEIKEITTLKSDKKGRATLPKQFRDSEFDVLLINSGTILLVRRNKNADK